MKIFSADEKLKIPRVDFLKQLTKDEFQHRRIADHVAYTDTLENFTILENIAVLKLKSEELYKSMNSSKISFHTRLVKEILKSEISTQLQEIQTLHKEIQNLKSVEHPNDDEITTLNLLEAKLKKNRQDLSNFLEIKNEY